MTVTATRPDSTGTISGARSGWRSAISIEALAYAVILIAALALRAIRLDAASLTLPEARLALAAWQVVTTGTPDFSAVFSPLVFGGAVISFALAGASNAAARLLPLLGGLALVASPLLFRYRLGRLPTLIAAAWLALSPTAVGAARGVSGSGLAALAAVLALAALDRFGSSGHPRRAAGLAGAALGAALLADHGAPIMLAALGLGVVFATATDEEDLLTWGVLRDAVRRFAWGRFAAGLTLTIVLIGTLLFVVPGGLGAAADQITRFLGGISRRTPGAIEPGLPLAIYEPVLIVFGLLGAWRASQSPAPWMRFLAGWGIAGLFLLVLYRGALPAHALWAVIPLAALAGIAITVLLESEHEAPGWGPWALAGGVIGLAAMTFASLSQHLRSPRLLTLPLDAPPDQIAATIPLDLVLVALWALLLLVLMMTAGSLWGSRAAWRGLGLGVLILGLVAALGQSAALSFTRASSPFEPANVGPTQPALDRLVAAAREIGLMSAGHPADVSITVQDSPDGLLAWALRDFNDVTYVQHVDPRVDSVLVITPAGSAEPALGSSYVGQDFVIVKAWTPGGLPLADVVRWLLYRTAPTAPEEVRVVLWVREDVYRLVPAGGR